MLFDLEEIPPGLVPWMIVRTHNYAIEQEGHRLHWQKGMFLSNGTHGEALLELRDQRFHIYTQATYPDYFIHVLRDTLSKLITDNWPGLKDRYAFAVPCRGEKNGEPCSGHFEIEALSQFANEGDETIRCQTCRTRQTIEELLYGLDKEDSHAKLIRLEEKMDGIHQKLDGFETLIANYSMTIMRAMANEAKDGPRLFTLEPVEGWQQWLPQRLFTGRYRLHLYCEAEGKQHSVRLGATDPRTGIYEFNAKREWLRQVAPYVNFITGVLKTILPLVSPTVSVFHGADSLDQSGLKHHLELAEKGTSQFLKELSSSESDGMQNGVLSEAARSGLLALHAFLREHDPNHEHIGLRRVPTYTGDYLWLCDKHYAEHQSKIPDVFT